MSRENPYEGFVFENDQDRKLLHALHNPPITVSPEELPHFWRRTEIIFTCKIPQPFEDGEWRAKNIRGSFGRSLLAFNGGGAGLAKNYPPWLALFETRPRIYGVTAPPPLVFCTYREKNLIFIQLTLFGYAELWRAEVIMALNTAFASGIRPSYFGWSYPSWEVVDWYWYRKDGFEPPKPRQNVYLQPVSPLKLGERAYTRPIDAGIFDSLLKRLTGLARWMGVDLRIEGRAFFDSYRKINIHPVVYRAEGGYVRFPFNDRRKLIVSIGSLDTFELCNIPKSFWPLLWLGQSAHMGKDVTHGFGKYKLLV